MVEGIVKAAESYVYTIIIGIIILLIGFGLGILAQKLVRKVLNSIELNKILSKAGIIHDTEKGISFVVSFLIYLITIVFFLNQLNITSIVLYLFLGAILALIVLTFVVGLKDIIPNFIAWILLQRNGHVKEGRRIEVKEIAGIIERVGYLETEIRTDQGDTLYVPNALFLKSKFSLKK